MSPQDGKRFPWLPYLVSLSAILVFALFPLISVFLVYLVAEPAGCRVDAGGIYPCVIAGIDIGGLLAFMGMLGWLMLATLPLGAIALAVWLVVLVMHLRRRPRAGTPGNTP